MPSQNVNNSFHDTDIDQVQSEIKLKDFCNTDEEKVDISEFEVNDSSQVDCNDPLYAPSTGADANSSLDDEEDIKVNGELEVLILHKIFFPSSFFPARKGKKWKNIYRSRNL